MIVPIVRKEILGSGRHGRTFAVRGAYLVMLACLTVPVLIRQADRMLNNPSFHASRMGRDFTIGFGLLQFFLVALMAPALSIGVIAAERASGNLELLHVAGVRPTQLVVGKWFARMGLLLLFLLSGLPLLVAGTLMGGVGAELIAYVFVQGAVAGALGTSLGFTLSGGMRQTVPALVLAYLFLLSLYIGGPILMVFADKALGAGYTVREEHLGWICPPFAFESFSRGQIPRMRAWSMVVPHVLLAAAMILPAPWFARPDTGDGRSGVRATARHGGPGRQIIHGNPIAWRDGRAARLSLTSKVLRWAYLLLGGVVIAGSVAASFMSDRRDPDFGRIAIFLLLMTGCAAALIAGSGAIAEERERRCMPLLALSRLTAGDILGGKLWGLLIYLWPMAVLPFIVAVLFFAGNDGIAIPVVVLLTGSLLFASAGFGLLISSFASRPATAAGIAIAVALVFVIVPPVMLDLLDVRGKDLLVIFNPLVGTLEMLEELGRRQYYPNDAGISRFAREDFVFGLVGMVFHTLVGTCCLLLTWSTLSTREEA